MFDQNILLPKNDKSGFEKFRLENPELTEKEALELWNTKPSELIY